MARCQVFGIVDVDTVPQSDASVQVNVHGGGAAALFTTEAGAVATANPMTTASNGTFGANQSVWIAEGTYDFVISGTGMVTSTFTDDYVCGSNSPGVVLTTTGDIPYASSANTLARLAVGTSSQVLVGGATPTWGVAHGQVVAYGTLSGGVSTTGTTFGTGVDLLAAPITFTADGTSDYVVSVAIPDFWNATGGANNQLLLNLGGSDAGRMLITTAPVGDGQGNCQTPILAPSAGAHTVNVRMICSAGTAHADGGAGGAGTFRPILVSVARL